MSRGLRRASDRSPLIPRAHSDRMLQENDARSQSGGMGIVRSRRRAWEVHGMIVGVPREIKSDEYRVAMLPVGAEELTLAGHSVLVESGAGLGSGIADTQYEAAGATIVTEAREIWSAADLV